MVRTLLLPVLAALVLGGCQASGPAEERAAEEQGEASPAASGAGAGASAAPADRSDTSPYSGIGANETVRFTGTEPFWGGQVAGAALTYNTPDNPDGDAIAVKRFAGRAGVSWSGRFQDQPFTLAVTEGQCSDGMSDRTYPFTATLLVAGEQRQGCAWSERRGFTPPDARK